MHPDIGGRGEPRIDLIPDDLGLSLSPVLVRIVDDQDAADRLSCEGATDTSCEKPATLDCAPFVRGIGVVLELDTSRNGVLSR